MHCALFRMQAEGRSITTYLLLVHPQQQARPARHLLLQLDPLCHLTAVLLRCLPCHQQHGVVWNLCYFLPICVRASASEHAVRPPIGNTCWNMLLATAVLQCCSPIMAPSLCSFTCFLLL
jgi:hypothetical protein